ncbi:uncharacterized protein LOC141637306 [Silene latifolia]|uniref:uncharacterized protein LOC141637306 n=1 Tax=Silene latifolia TaxID=37657 RepID=UPI003D76F21A
MDIQAIGAFYTWNNKQPPETRVYSRIDRFLVNQEWLDTFPDHYANFMPEGHFDHTPCIVSKDTRGHNRNRPFKYYNMWSTGPGFNHCVQNVWSQRIEGSKMYRLVRKLKMLKADLKNLNREHFSDVENKADIAQAKLIHIQKQLISRLGDEELMQQEYNTYQESKRLHQAKMDFLKQKAKAH